MTSMIRRLSPFAAIAVAVASVAAGPTRHPASAETTLAAAVTLVPQPLAPQQWCRPVVSAAIDPAPLACWLTLSQAPSADVPMSLVGMNLGDLPPWGDIDIEGIGASLARYEQALEADRLAAEAAAKAADVRRAPTTAGTRTAPPTIAGSTGGSGPSYDELYHRCFTLAQFAACSALFDHLEAGGGSAGGEAGSSPARESEADRQAAVDAQFEAEIDGHIAILAAGIARNWDAANAARAQIAEQGANSAAWDFYGWADPRTFGRVAADGRHIDHQEFYRFVGSACPGRWSGYSPIGLFLKPYEPMTLIVTCN